MNEQKLLNKEFFKFIRYNLLMFIFIFIIFGLFFYILVTKITYTSVSIELKESAQQLINSFSRDNIDFQKNRLFAEKKFVRTVVSGSRKYGHCGYLRYRQNLGGEHSRGQDRGHTRRQDRADGRLLSSVQKS